MRPLPRLHAITDPSVLALDDLGVRAAAIAAAGPSVALHARDRNSGGARLAALAARFVSLAWPPEASVIVAGRPDVARAVGAQGVQLASGDLTPSDARAVLRHGWIGRSVHSADQAARAADEGADYVVAGSVFETATHPGLPPAGLELITAAARSGLPVIAIGGVSADNVMAVRDAGAWGVAAIRALWHAKDPAAAALALLEPWMEDA